MTELKYINAIRATLTSTKVFLKRTINEINLNAYNDDILTFHQGNMDIHFILNSYACIGYIISYISKTEKGVSQLLQ
jgi:hypothetical protein